MRNSLKFIFIELSNVFAGIILNMEKDTAVDGHTESESCCDSEEDVKHPLM